MERDGNGGRHRAEQGDARLESRRKDERDPVITTDAARGKRLDIPAGTAVRFEPGQTRQVTLIPLSGKREVFGFRQQVMGKL